MVVHGEQLCFFPLCKVLFSLACFVGCSLIYLFCAIEAVVARESQNNLVLFILDSQTERLSVVLDG